MTIDRRSLIRNLAVAGAAVTLAPRLAWSQSATITLTTPAPFTVDPKDPWASLPSLLARIAPPRIPRRDFAITKYGGSIPKAIAAAHKAGGGRVVVPAGDYETGPIHLKSRVE